MNMFRSYFINRIQQVKQLLTSRILPSATPEAVKSLGSVVSSFSNSYSIGRLILESLRMNIGRQNANVLLVGAAGGRDWLWLVGSGYNVEIMDLGHHSWSQTSFLGDASDESTWRSTKGQYDAIIACEVIEHMPEDFSFLRLARRNLTEDGVLVITVPFAHDAEVTHVRAYTWTTLKRLLSAAGFELKQGFSRPGLLELIPRLLNSINYGLVLLMPSAESGSHLLNRLLRLEYRLNARHTLLTRIISGRSSSGCLFVLKKTEPGNYLIANKKAFTKGV